MDKKVFAIDCKEYNFAEVYQKMKQLLERNHLLDFVKEGMLIVIKANLVAASKPDQAVVTHPIVVASLCKILIERKAQVVVGDSPGGLFNETILNGIYHKTNMKMVEDYGAKLNHNFNQEVVDIDNLKIVKHLDCSCWLLKADAIINFAKMKTHGMMSLSGSVKNMFGSVPGTIKLEYHYRYPSHQDFANMLIDIQEFYKCKLHLVDAIVAMEGNGPTMGTPRHVGLLLASQNPYHLDLVCCRLMNLDPLQVPTIQEAISRNLSVATFEEVPLNMDIQPYIVESYKNITHNDTIQFYSGKNNIFKKMIGKVAKAVMLTRPQVKKKQCIGCQKCANICPAKAITMVKSKPKINKDVCIRCFCCQEFCPIGAMKTHRTTISKLLTHKKS